METGNWQLENILLRFRFPLLILLVGLILLAGGLLYFKSGGITETKVEVLGTNADSRNNQNIAVEIAGEVIHPNVYKLAGGSRVDDLLVVAGGFTANADRVWTDKYLNRAAKLADGQKIFIPKQSDLAPNQDWQSSVRGAKVGGGDQTVSSVKSTDSTGLININTASLSQLDKLPGIGQVYGQNIIEHRPYSDTSELLSKGVLKSSVYNKVKDLITIY